MGSVSLILYGLLDLLLEVLGLVVVVGEGVFDTPEEKICNIGSILLDLAKFVVVVSGFICVCCAENGGVTEKQRQRLIQTFNVLQWIILPPAVLLAAFIVVVIIVSPTRYLDIRALTVIVFLIYATLKFMTFYGYCEFLKKFINDIRKTSISSFGSFRYIPIHLQEELQHMHYIVGYPVSNNS